MLQQKWLYKWVLPEFAELLSQIFRLWEGNINSKNIKHWSWLTSRVVVCQKIFWFVTRWLGRCLSSKFRSPTTEIAVLWGVLCIRERETCATLQVPPQNWKLIITIDIRFYSKPLTSGICDRRNIFGTRFFGDPNFWGSFWMEITITLSGQFNWKQEKISAKKVGSKKNTVPTNCMVAKLGGWYTFFSL